MLKRAIGLNEDSQFSTAPLVNDCARAEADNRMIRNAPSIATTAEYFRAGIVLGMLKSQDANSWATSLIALMPEPPEELTDVALCTNAESAVSALGAVSGYRVLGDAAGMLFDVLRNSVPGSNEELRNATNLASRIAQAFELDRTIYYEFDAVDDDMFLAVNRGGVSIEDCRRRLYALLAKYSFELANK